MSVASRLKVSAMPAAIWLRGRSDPVVRLRLNKSWVNPFPVYEAARAKGPIYHSDTSGLYVVTGHEEATAVLKDGRFVVATSNSHEAVSALGSPDSMLKLNPPRLTQIRKIVTKALSPRAITDMSGWITELAHGLLDDITGQREFDLVHHIAYPLPLRVVTRILGIPPMDEAQFAEWGKAMGNTLEPFIPQHQRIVARVADKAMYAYLQQLVADHRANPTDDILSALIAATDDDGVRLTDHELLVNCQVILVAGVGTMVGLVGSGMDMLFDRPELWRRLQASPDLVPTLVDEVLRLESPIQMTPRVAAEDVDLFGYKVKKGERALVVIGAANRDPRVFPEPDRLDVDRGNAGKHLAFAAGPHYCIGASLARLEGRTIFEAMLERMPEISRAGVPERRPLLTARGLNSLPTAVRPAVLPRR